MINEAEKPEGWPDPTHIGVISIKQCPAYRAAIIEADPAQADTQSSLFNALHQFITSHGIAMTTPIELTYGAAAIRDDADGAAMPTSMAFLYPTPDTDTLKTDERVHVRDMPAQAMLSIGVRGNYNAHRFQNALRQLNDHISKYADMYTPTGKPRYLGYNSPFVPWFLKYGEVQVPVKVSE